MSERGHVIHVTDYILFCVVSLPSRGHKDITGDYMLDGPKLSYMLERQCVLAKE